MVEQSSDVIYVFKSLVPQEFVFISVCLICYYFNISYEATLVDLVFVESVIIIGTCLDELNVCYSQHTVLTLSAPVSFFAFNLYFGSIVDFNIWKHHRMPLLLNLIISFNR